MNLSRVDVWAAIAYLAGPQLMATAVAFGSAWPDHGKQIVAVAGGIVFSAGLILRLFNNQTGAPATSIVQGATVVSSKSVS